MSKPAPSSQNDPPVKTANQGMKPNTGKPKGWRK